MCGWSWLMLISCTEPDTSAPDHPGSGSGDGTPTPTTELDCGDGEDDDIDGLIDCDDSDCICIETDCSDGIDDDQDGLIDCDDSDCLSACVETDCTDGLDGDGDGLLDCEDSDCIDECSEICDDGEDNDQDGLADCSDDECYGIAGCTGPYTVQLYHEDLYIFWAWDILVGPRGVRPYPFLAELRSSFSLTGTPVGSWGGQDFSCSGNLETQIGLSYFPYTQSYAMGGADVGPTSLMNGGYLIDFSPQREDGSLSLDSCPFVDIPSVRLVFLPDHDNVYVDSPDIGLVAQYSARNPEDFPFENYDGSIYMVRFMQDAYPYRTPSWVGMFD